MMESRGPGGPDVHRRTRADRLEAFKNFDFVSRIVVDPCAGTVAVVAGRRRRHGLGRLPFLLGLICPIGMIHVFLWQA